MRIYLIQHFNVFLDLRNRDLFRSFIGEPWKATVEPLQEVIEPGVDRYLIDWKLEAKGSKYIRNWKMRVRMGQACRNIRIL